MLNSQKEWRTSLEGDVWLYSAKVGTVVLKGIQLIGDLHAGNLIVKENLWRHSDESELFEVQGNVELYNARIAGATDLEGIQVSGDLSFAHAALDILRLGGGNKRTQIGGSLILYGASVTREVFLVGAQVQGALICSMSNLGILIADAIGGNRMEIGGLAELQGIKVPGGVSLQGCRIAGELSLHDAHIGAGLFCASFLERESTEIGGNLMLGNAEISGQVNLDGVLIGGFLYLIGTRITGGLSCMRVGEKRTEIGKQALLSYSRIADTVLFQGAKIGGTLHAARAEISESLVLDAETEIAGPIEMEGLETGHLNLHGNCCRGRKLNLALAKINKLEVIERLPEETDLSGYEVAHFVVPNDDYRGLVASTKPFRLEPYLTMEKWLRERGQDDLANQIYLDMRRRRRRETTHGWRRFGDWFLDFTVRYGIESYRLMAYLLLVFCLSTWLFSKPGALKPEPAVVETPHTREAFWVGLQTTFPMFNVSAIVYRPTGMGMLSSFQFNLDHGPSIKLKNHCYRRLNVEAGDHIISHDNTFLAGQDPQKVHVEARQTVYFIYHANGMWLAFEVADDQKQAAQTVSSMKEQN